MLTLELSIARLVAANLTISGVVSLRVFAGVHGKLHIGKVSWLTRSLLVNHDGVILCRFNLRVEIRASVLLVVQIGRLTRRLLASWQGRTLHN